MKKFLLFILACVFIAPSFSQEEKPITDGKPSNEIQTIRLANKLAKYGYENFSALSLIEAATMLNSVSTQELNPVSYEAGEMKNEAIEKKEKAAYTVESLLKDAANFADGNKHLLALIDDAKANAATVTRGRVGGPGKKVTSVYGNSSDAYQVRFVANSLAEVFISGDGDTDLDLYVYDSNGNFITKDDDYSDDCYVSWVPKWTGNFIIKIVNRGPIYNQYVMLTN